MHDKTIVLFQITSFSLDLNSASRKIEALIKGFSYKFPINVLYTSALCLVFSPIMSYTRLRSAQNGIAGNFVVSFRFEAIIIQ